MAFTLQISFGGLCLFTFDPSVSKHSPCWHVHMPSMVMPPETHCQRLLFDGNYIGATCPQFVDIASKAIDLTGLPTTTSTKPDLKHLLPWVSDFGGAGVAKPFAADPPMFGALAARVSLPTGIRVITGEDTQQMLVTLGTSVVSFHAVGLVILQFQIAAATLTIPELNNLQLAPVTNPETGTPEMFLFFGNLPGNAYDPTVPRTHAGGSKARHFAAYYTLLNGPKATPIPETPSNTAGKGMDPVTCMIGGGCQDGDTSC